MKLLPLASVCLPLVFTACDTMTAPISSSSFDPLTPPGSGRTLSTVDTSRSFAPGQFVRATMDSTAFFNRRPRGDAEADRLLRRDTQMKVISADGSYVRVELDSGEVGFVPMVMVEDPTTTPATTTEAAPNPNEVQVYPPVPANEELETLPVFEPTTLPDAAAVPPVTDSTAVPPVTDSTFPASDATMDATPEEQTPAPLPPNTEELEAEGIKVEAEVESAE